MAIPFPANPKRLDPYKNFKFRLKWDGKYVYGGSKLTGAEAHHRGRGASQRRRSLDVTQVARAVPSMKPSRWSAA